MRRIATAAAAAMLTVALSAGATIKVGTDGAGALVGTRYADHLTGKGGDDFLDGRAGNDVFADVGEDALLRAAGPF